MARFSQEFILANFYQCHEIECSSILYLFFCLALQQFIFITLKFRPTFLCALLKNGNIRFCRYLPYSLRYHLLVNSGQHQFRQPTFFLSTISTNMFFPTSVATNFFHISSRYPPPPFTDILWYIF